MVDGPQRTVVIVGGGTAGWMAAAALARFLPAGTPIRLVESAVIGTVGVGEATIPQLRLFNAGLGIDEDAMLRETGGTFKLGIEFVGWSGEPDGVPSRYIHAFGTIGRGLGLLPFHPYWLRGRALGLADELWAYSASAQAARAGRFARDLGRPELPSGVAWAFHFDAALYATFLRRYAEAAGVMRTEGEVAEVSRDGYSGAITHLVLRGGEQVAGDLFVDCTGFRSLLLGGALETPFESWTHLLPCDRAVAVPSARGGATTPFTRATARAAGWQWRIPLQHRTGNGLVYSSAHLSDEEAAATLLANLDGPALDAPRPLRFTTGRRREAWAGNCIALGLAAGFMEPLESTSIHLVQSGIARLLELWPGAGATDVARAEYNRQTEREWLAIRDFLILHYWANGRDEPFWRERRATALPDSLAERVALFREQGLIASRPESLFTEVAWLQVMTGQGIAPAAWHPLAGALAPEQLREFLALAARHARAVAERMPSHDQYLARHCAAASTATPEAA